VFDFCHYVINELVGLTITMVLHHSYVTQWHFLFTLINSLSRVKQSVIIMIYYAWQIPVQRSARQANQ